MQELDPLDTPSKARLPALPPTCGATNARKIRVHPRDRWQFEVFRQRQESIEGARLLRRTSTESCHWAYPLAEQRTGTSAARRLLRQRSGSLALMFSLSVDAGE